MELIPEALGQLLRCAPAAVFVVGAGGRLVFANDELGRLVGYPVSELIDRPVDLWLSLGADAGCEVEDAASAGAAPTWVERGCRQRDGVMFTAEVCTRTTVLEGQPVVVGIMRARTDLTLPGTEFGELIEAAPDAVIGIDATGTIRLANPQAEAMFGYSRAELIGANLELLVPDAGKGVHPTRRDEYFAAPRRRPMGIEMELAGRRGDGTEFPVEISLAPMQTSDGMLATAWVRDVTDRVQARQERERLAARAAEDRLAVLRQQSQRLESLGELAGGVAHDFNNLISVILNYSAFVSDSLVTLSEDHPNKVAFEEARADLREVHQAGERAARLTRQLLAFARRETIRPEILELNGVVRGIEELLKRTLGEHISLSIYLTSSDTTIEIDPGQLDQILVNLAVNARDAMPGGGSLTIDTGVFDVDESFAQQNPDVSTGPYVRLRVSDSGVGMTPDVLTRAFEPFFTTKPSGEGTGLGLATVYGIVTQATGSIRLYSEPGVGTTATILFPASNRTAEPRLAEPAVAAPRTATILLVEDEPALREVTRRMLARNGYQVLVADGGPQAIEIASTHGEQIDLLLTDVVMPGMGGNDVAIRVQALRPAVRVLFMSGYAEPIITVQGRLTAGVKLVSKPLSEPVLLAAVLDALATG